MKTPISSSLAPGRPACWPRTPAARRRSTSSTTTEDLAAIAREVGGDKIKVGVAVARLPGSRTSWRPSPASSCKLNKADLLIAVGRELGDRLAAPAHHPEPQRAASSPARTATSTPR